MFNTDQGSQFTSAVFTGTLTAAAIRISMDGRGRWMDNVFIRWLDGQPGESIWTTAITVFEIRFGLQLLGSNRRRSLLVAAFASTIDEVLDGRVLPFDGWRLGRRVPLPPRNSAPAAASTSGMSKSPGSPLRARQSSRRET